MTIAYTRTAKKQLAKLDRPIQVQIKSYLDRLKMLDNPHMSGKALVGNYAGLWRYRVGDYRLICEIHDEKIFVTVLRIAHRKEVYRD